MGSFFGGSLWVETVVSPRIFQNLSGSAGVVRLTADQFLLRMLYGAPGKLLGLEEDAALQGPRSHVLGGPGMCAQVCVPVMRFMQLCMLMRMFGVERALNTWRGIIF